MPVKIPANLIPLAPVDYDMEQSQLLGFDLALCDGFRVPPVTAARIMALELVCSDFFLHPDTCAVLDTAAALAICTCTRTAVQDLVARAEDTSGQTGLAAFPRLAAAAASLANAHGEAIVRDYVRICRWILEVPFYGYHMLPGAKGGRPKECWFDGEFFGSVVASAAHLTATPVEFVLWEMPLCAVWHTVAQRASALGVKGIERPPDTDTLDRLTAEAEAREARGELHPWQFRNPVVYGLSDTQFRANPELGPLFDQMIADYTASGHRPLDPAKYPLPPRAGEAAGGACTADVGSAFRAPDGAPNGTAGGALPSASKDERTSSAGLVLSAGEAGRTASPGLVLSAGEAERTAQVQDLSCCLPGTRGGLSAVLGDHGYV